MTERLSKEYFERLHESANSDTNPVKYLSIDPGNHNGVCGYDAKFYTVFSLTVLASNMVIFLEQFEKIKTCIIEDYKLYPHKAQGQTYSDMETSRVIGRTESWAARKNVELVKQMATVKETGYKWAGKKPLPKTNPLNHQLDAHIHFIYWGVKTNRIKLEELLRK